MTTDRTDEIAQLKDDLIEAMTARNRAEASLASLTQERDTAIADRDETQAEFSVLNATLTGETLAAIERADAAESSLTSARTALEQMRDEMEQFDAIPAGWKSSRDLDQIRVWRDRLDTLLQPHEGGAR